MKMITRHFKENTLTVQGESGSHMRWIITYLNKKLFLSYRELGGLGKGD